MSERATFGSRLRAARGARGLSQDDVASELGVANTSVSEWELNKKMPGVERLPAIKELLKVTLDWLVCGDVNAVMHTGNTVQETAAAYFANVPLTPKSMRAIRMASVFSKLNEPQQKALIDVASNMPLSGDESPRRPAARSARAPAPETEKQK